MEFEAWKLVVGALSLGGAWGGAKAALNGTRERVQKVEARTDAHDEKLSKQGEQLARVETKIDILLDRSNA